MLQLNALLLDWDGTVADSLTSLYKIYSLFLEKYEKSPTKEEFDELNGPSIAEIAHLLKNRHHLNPSPDELLEAYSSFLEGTYADSIELFPSAKETLLFAKEQGLKLALVTSANQKLVESSLAKHEIASLFDLVVTADDALPGKPHPAIYQKALHLLRLTPSNALAVEDSYKGVQAATDAGIFTLWMTSKPQPPMKHSLQIRDWNGILKYLKKLYELSDV